MSSSSARQVIIETASELFYKNGYNLTGINEIIREAGIAKATLYNNFKSKDDICIAYLNYKHSRFISAFVEATNAAEEGNGQLIAIFDFLLAFYASDDFNGCWCINTVSEIPKDKMKIIAEIQGQKKELRKVILGLVQKNKPDLSVEQAQSLASQLYLLYEGAVSESYLLQERWPIDTAKFLTKQLLTA
ncbi:MAG: TetR/AcrR family transcriptional regulator [Bacteroidota bacterium]